MRGRPRGARFATRSARDRERGPVLIQKETDCAYLVQPCDAGGWRWTVLDALGRETASGSAESVEAASATARLAMHAVNALARGRRRDLHQDRKLLSRGA